MAGQKQMLECTRCKLKSINSSFGNYEDRTMANADGQKVVWSREKYEYYNAQPKKSAVHDWSRAHLNFEIDPRTGRLQDVDHNKPSLRKRWQAVMDKHYTAMQTYKNPKNGKVTTKKRPVRSNEIKLVGTLMGGNRERMHEIAYDREVIVGKAGIGKNGNVQRNPDVEEWAMDCYKWACKTWGQDNIVSFVVHLDETNPHIHCDYVPLVGGELSYTKMMHGRSGKAESSKFLKALHDDFAREVGEKWGLERGDSIAKSGAGWKSMEEHQREVTEAEELKDRLYCEINDLSVDVWESENRESELEESIRKKEQAERAISTKIANLEKKLAAAKITEEEYNRKVEYHTNKLNEVMGELDKLREEKRQLKQETAQLPALQKEVQELQEKKQEAMDQVSYINRQVEQETARLEAVKIGGLVHQSISAFVRPAFFKDNQPDRDRRKKFIDNLFLLAERQRIELMEFFVKLVASMIVYVAKELGEDEYYPRLVRVHNAIGIPCTKVENPEDISAYPDYKQVADDIIMELLRLAQLANEKEEERLQEEKKRLMKEDALKWVKLSRGSLDAGRYIMARYFGRGDLFLFLDVVRETAQETGFKSVERAIQECMAGNLMGEEYKQRLKI